MSAWLDRKLAYSIGGELVPETNIMKITFQSTAPDLARLTVDNVRTAFIEASVAMTRASARAAATTLSAQAERERERLLQLQAFKADLERQTGIMVGEGGVTDADVSALRAAQQNAQPPVALRRDPVQNRSQLLKAQLADMDSAIAESGRMLGPNNPLMIEMRRRREFVAAQLSGAPVNDNVAEQTMRRLAAITALAHQSAERLTTVSDKQLALRLVQDEIKRRRSLFDKVTARAGKEFEISNVSDASLTPIGVTTVEPDPVFPNLALILGGCAVLGLVCGALLAFMIEAIGRRVRAAQDLAGAIDIPLLGEMPSIVWARAKIERVRKARPARPAKAARELKALGKMRKLDPA
jgi:uncharacterized protein involved in exopolysaccharide biosynthesis